MKSYKPTLSTTCLPVETDETKETTKEILTYLREENEKSRAALRAEADANRSFLTTAMGWISVPLSALLAIAGIFGLRSISGLHKEANRQYESLSQQQQRQAAVLSKQAELTGKLLGDQQQQLAEELKLKINKTSGDADRALSEVVAGARADSSKIIKNAEAQTQSQLDNKFNEGHVEATITTAFQNSPLVDSLINAKLKDNRQIKQTIDLALQKQLPDAVSKVKNAARPTIRASKDSVSVQSDGTVTVSEEFDNKGNQNALDVTTFNAVSISNPFADRNAAILPFAELAKEIAQTKARGTKLPHAVVPNGVFDIYAYATLTPVDLARVTESSAIIIFMFWLEYSAPNGDNFYTVKCGSTTGKLETVTDCPFDDRMIEPLLGLAK